MNNPFKRDEKEPTDAQKKAVMDRFPAPCMEFVPFTECTREDMAHFFGQFWHPARPSLSLLKSQVPAYRKDRDLAATLFVELYLKLGRLEERPGGKIRRKLHLTTVGVSDPFFALEEDGYPRSGINQEYAEVPQGPLADAAIAKANVANRDNTHAVTRAELRKILDRAGVDLEDALEEL